MGAPGPGAPGAAVAALPAWYPEWAHRLAELYFSGTTSMFVVHGNTHDATPLEGGTAPRYGHLSEFLAGQLFGRWDLVLRYDLARGLRCLAGADAERLKDMVSLASRKVGGLADLADPTRRDPTRVLATLDRFVQKNVLADEEERLSVALIVDHAAYLVPRGDRASLQTATQLVTFLNWANSPYVKRLNMAFVLIDARLADLSQRLAESPHVATLDVPLPVAAERLRFLAAEVGERDPATFSDYGLDAIATLTAGISLTDLRVLVQSSIEGGRRLDEARFRELKKRLIERQAAGLLEFVQPSWGLDMVVGHTAAKRRLEDDAELLRRGALDSVPMGYLVTGPVGTGKSFLAQCAAGSLGIPCVKLKNFRSKYVGETEGNLERVLTVLRSMGPVVVIVDEADAMLGDRHADGDAGVSSRIFGMIAAQMGDTRYRGRILWMLLTARPDYLPIDLKRQGRAEVHIPLFYPSDEAEIRELFVVLARKLGTRLAAQDVPPIPPEHLGHLSGADIEGMVGRAWRTAQLRGADHIEPEVLAEVLAGFTPSTQTLERELQQLAAIIECTDREFLPAHILAELAARGGRAGLQERLNTLKRLTEGT